MFKESQMEHLFSGVDFSVVNKGYVVASIQDSIHHTFLSKWSTDVNRDISQTRTGRNKLRTYKQFKQIYRTECYATMFLPFKRLLNLGVALRHGGLKRDAMRDYHQNKELVFIVLIV